MMYNKTMTIWEKSINSIIEWLNKLSPEGKRRLALFCTAIVVVLLTISVIISMRSSDREKLSDAEPDAYQINMPEFMVRIPAEELFLPDEPDYLPGVILERERRESWTEQDASEFWQDPLKFGEEQWRKKIETAVDELLENIP